MQSTRILFAFTLAFAATPGWAVEDLPSADLIVQAEIRRGDYFEFGFDALWMMSGPKLTRIDAVDNSATEFWIEGATGFLRSIAVGEGAVWLPDTGNQIIYKFDPTSKRVVLKVFAEMFGREGSIGVGEGSIWAVTQNDRVLQRIDAKSGKVEAEIELPSPGSGVLVDAGVVWVTSHLKSELYRIDAASNAIDATIPLHRGPRRMAAGEGGLWVLCDADAVVERVDRELARVVASFDFEQPGKRGDITVGGGYVWVSMPGVPLAQIDPRRNELVRRFHGWEQITTLRFGGGSLWRAQQRIQPPS
jgi:streptogramin lyase